MKFINLNSIKKLNMELIAKLSLSIIIITFLTGPAIPDIFATILSIIFLYELINKRLINENIFFLLSIFILLLIPNLKSIYFPMPFYEFLVNIRYFLFSLFISIFFGKNLNYFIKVLLLFCLFLSFDLIFQYIFSFNIFGIPIDPSHNSSRASSFFRDELVAGSYIYKLGLPVIGYYLFFRRFQISLTLIIIFELAILCSGERMTFILFNSGMLILISILIKDFQKILILFFSIILIFSTMYLISDRVKHRTDSFISIFNKEKIMNDGHFAHAWTATEIFKKNIFFGTGHKTFRLSCKNQDIKEKVKSLSEGCSTHPHNTYFEILSDFGLFGFISFLGFVIISLVKFVKNNLHNSELSGFFVTFLCIFWPLSSHGNFFNNRVAVLNFMIIGILFYFCSNKNLFKK